MELEDQSRALLQQMAESGLLPPVDVCGQELTIYTETMPLVRAMLRDFQAAKSRIWVENYIVLDDHVGESLGQTLVDRAAAGVDVRLLYDPVGSYRASARFFERLRRGGVQVHAFHSPSRLLLTLRLGQANIRDHRRLYVVDDQIGYFGGMNIGDFGGRGSRRPKRSRRSAVEANWRDVHLRMRGGRQNDLARAFQFLWQRASGQPPSDDPPWQLEAMLAATDDVLCFFDSDPRDPARRPEQALGPLLRQARQSIHILCSYFIPQGTVLEELYAARHRGVQVQVVVPGDSDVKLVQWATRHFYRELLLRGIDIYERQGQMLHTKAIIIDGQWSVVGSTNLDPRSMRINLEFFAAIRHRPLARTLEQVAAWEQSQSERIDLPKVARRPWWQRWLDAAAWRLRRWL